MQQPKQFENETFVYNTVNSNQSRFEAFMQLTNEKSLLAKYIGNRIADNFSGSHQTIIDVGAGTGELISQAIKESNISPHLITLNAIEPAPNLMASIQENLQKVNLADIDLHLFTQPFETYCNTAKADILLASHLYHIEGEEYQNYLEKMTGLLNATGKLLFIYRSKEMDDLRSLRIKFTSKLIGETYSPRDINSVIPYINQVIRQTDMSASFDTITSVVNFNDADSTQTQLALEFIMNINFDNYSKGIKNSILGEIGNFLSKHDNVLSNKQDIVTIQPQLLYNQTIPN